MKSSTFLIYGIPGLQSRGGWLTRKQKSTETNVLPISAIHVATNSSGDSSLVKAQWRGHCSDRDRHVPGAPGGFRSPRLRFGRVFATGWGDVDLIRSSSGIPHRRHRWIPLGVERSCGGISVGTSKPRHLRGVASCWLGARPRPDNGRPVPPRRSAVFDAIFGPPDSDRE